VKLARGKKKCILNDMDREPLNPEAEPTQVSGSSSLRPDIPDTYVLDKEEAHTIAEAADYYRTREAFARSVAEVFDRYGKGDIQREEADRIFKELKARYPEPAYNRDYRLSISYSKKPDYYKDAAKDEAKLAERSEYWAGILNKHPVEGLTAKDVQNFELRAQRWETHSQRLEDEANELEEGLASRGFDHINLDFMHIRGLVANYIEHEEWRFDDLRKRFRKLSQNPTSTVGKLTAVVTEFYRDAARELRERAAENKKVLQQIEEGTYRPEPRLKESSE
jgi:hypothetical protein